MAEEKTDTQKRELMFEAELLNNNLERMQDHLGKLEKQMAEMITLKESLDAYDQVEEGAELLVPLAGGIFASAKATADKRLHVNVGQGVVVPKTIPEVKQMLDEQQAEMQTYEQQVHAEFDKMIARLREIEQEFKE